MNYLERAAQRIDHLHAIVCRLNEEAMGMNSPAGASKISKKVGPNWVPVEYMSTAREAVQALIEALALVDRRVHPSMASDPPEWWRNLRAIVGNKRAEYAASHPALLNAFDILDGHVSDENFTLGCLIFLTDHLDRKIIRVASPQGFRAPDSPYSDRISFSFDLQFEDKIDEALSELHSKVPVFPKECVGFLRAALDEASDIVEH